MYTLYFLPGASSLATHVLLNELDQKYDLIKRPGPDIYTKINPANKVPTLVDDNEIFTEGAAIALYLLQKHQSSLWPSDIKEREAIIRWMMFANASVYTAYVKLFFANGNITDSVNKEKAVQAAVSGLLVFWDIANQQLGKTRFLAGDTISMGDIFLTVYAGWNKNFPGLTLGENAQRMVREVSSRDSFRKAIAEEGIDFKLV